MAIAKTIEISAESGDGFPDAIEKGVKAASEKLDNVHSCWVKDLQVGVDNGKITSYRVWLKVTFQLR